MAPGLIAGILGQLLLLGVAVLLSRRSGPWLVFWSGLVELAGLFACIASRSNFPGRFAVGMRIGWAVAAVPCVISALVLAWIFQLGQVL
jgi:hypothetical protein